MPLNGPELLKLAKAQKLLIHGILTSILAVVLLSVGAPVVAVFGLVVHVASLILQLLAVYRIARALGKTAVLWLLGVFIPCGGIILLLILNQEATKALEKAGLKVGFFGAKMAEVEQISEGRAGSAQDSKSNAHQLEN
jgi:DNA integrity scanning protein DisA with diadenylate cyclase activity